MGGVIEINNGSTTKLLYNSVEIKCSNLASKNKEKKNRLSTNIKYFVMKLLLAGGPRYHVNVFYTITKKWTQLPPKLFT